MGRAEDAFRATIKGRARAAFAVVLALALQFPFGVALAQAPAGAGAAEDGSGPKPPSQDQPAAPSSVPSLDGEIPFTKEALAKELEAIDRQLQGAKDEKAQKRLERERETLAAALAVLEQKEQLEARLAALPEREARAKEQAEQIAKELATPLTLPDPFTEQDKIAAEDEERRLAKALLEANQELERAATQPDQLRAEIATHEQRLEALDAELERLRKEEAQTSDPEAKKELRRRLAVLAVARKRHEQQIANLKQWIELLQRTLPVLRLERDNLERMHERAKARVQLYSKAWEDRLAAERARLAEQQRSAEILSREGLPFEQTRGEAEKQVLLEADRTKALQQRVTRWENRLVELRAAIEAERTRSEELRKALEKTSNAVEARTALLLTRFTRAVQAARATYDEHVAPARDEAEQALREARNRLGELERERRRMREAITRMHELAHTLFEELHKRYPGVYPESKWAKEEQRWIAIEQQLLEQYQERERALRTLIERLVEVIELATKEGERIAELEAILRKRSFWLREEPVIEARRLAPALAALRRYGETIRTYTARPQKAIALLRDALVNTRNLLGLLLLLALAIALRTGHRKAAERLRAKSAAEITPPVPWRVRLERAGLRVLQALEPGALFSLWAGSAHLWFANRLTRALFWISLLVTASRATITLLRALFRPFDPAWRLIPLADDVARLVYRFAQRVVFFSAVYLGAIALAPLLGEQAQVALKPVLDLLYEYVLILLGLIALSSPAVTSRLLRLISPDMAERLRRLLVPLGLFVGLTVIAIFSLDAIGYRNAARSVTGSLLSSLVVIALGLVLDRTLFHVVLRRLQPQGEESATGGAETAAEEEEARRRREWITEVVGTLTDAIVVIGIVIGILFAFDVEPSTIEEILATPIIAPAEDGTGGVLVRDALSAALILVLTYLSYRYVRGFVSLYVLSRLGLSPGARFGVTSVAGYLIVGTGVVLALGRLGIDLGELEWLLAAAGVGIGFGLQEILSNFVSGLILLIERPIEVGDIVSVGELEGEVEQITIRATTVKTRDNVSVIVPNKDFITSTVINWTHGDPRIRLRVPIGVAYGSNVQLVRETLAMVASNYGRVLKRPAPTVSFRGFGASSLDFELAVWIASPDPSVRRQVTSDLCAAIDAAFRRANIEIPFPQLDLHVRKGEPLEVALGSQPSDGEAGATEQEESERARNEAQIKKSIARQRAKKSRGAIKAPRLDKEES